MAKQSSKSGKSSKTARVLNLLTDPDSIEEAAEKPAPAESQPESGSRLPDDRKTQQRIRGALEGALEMELAEAAPVRPVRARPGKNAAPPEPAASAESAPAAKPRPERESASEPAAEDAEEQQQQVFPLPTAAASPMHNAVQELKSVSQNEPDDFICFNVTQALVEDKVEKYMKMFGLCTCNRCKIDVIALSLSNLPAKYVVARPHELIPRLSMYEQRYNAAVVTQVMSACRKVLARPHHRRDESK